MTIPPRSRTHKPRTARILALASVLALGATLSACAPRESTGAETTSPATSAGPSATAPAETGEPTPSSAPGSAPAATTPAGAPLCTAASLAGSLDATGGGAAGHIYMKLIVSNSSSADCILDGYPGVSLVAAGSTEPIGEPAERDASAPSSGPITLAPGDSAAAVLRYTQAGNYQDCNRVDAAAVLVYPPSATDSLSIAHPLTACSNAEIKLLTIGAFQP